MEQVVLSGSYHDNNSVDLMRFLDDVPADPSIEIDISRVRFFGVGPMTLFLGVILGWVKEGRSVQFSASSKTSKAFQYLQRMDFFKCCGMEFQETFERREPANKFVPFLPIDRTVPKLADSISKSIADCLVGCEAPEKFEFTDQPPEDGLYESLAYSVTELVKNVEQHSKGFGYVIAQNYPHKNRVQICIVDTGIGIWESFKEANSPHMGKIQSDVEAIRLSLQFEVSSKNHQIEPYSVGLHQNAGVGLTLLSEIALRTGGRCDIVSKRGAVSASSTISTKSFNVGLSGTFLSLCFSRKELDKFGALLETVKSELLQRAGYDPSALDYEGVFDD